MIAISLGSLLLFSRNDLLSQKALSKVVFTSMMHKHKPLAFWF
jgi:hypothetical protein